MTTGKRLGVVWDVEAQRVSLFHPPGVEVAASEIWRRFTGNDPETDSSNRAQRTSTASGPYLEGTLTVQVSVVRTDIVFAGTPKLDQLVPPPPVSRWDGVPTEFSTRVREFIGEFEQLTRIAFGCQLIYGVDTVGAGYRVLAEYLPSVKIDFDNSSDFLYQINRPVSSRACPGLKINVISKWAVRGVTIGQFMLAGAGQIAASPVSRVFHATVDVDINTDADRTDFIPKQSLGAIWDEFQLAAARIADQGDVP